MKKVLNTLLVAMAILLALVACSPQNEVTDELVSATLTTTGNTRSLVAEVDFDISKVTKWMYTAEKADNGLKTGATTTEVKLEDGKTELLSQGSWNFNLYGYDSSNNLLCSGSIENVTVTTAKHDVKITVKPSQTAEGKGSIVISDDIKIVSSSGAEYDKGTGDDEYTKVIEVYKGNETISFYDSSDESKNLDSLLTNVDSGLYRVLVSYRGTANDGETTYTAASATKVINVYDNLSTTVGGTVTETKQSASVTKSGATVTASATSETITVKETEGKKVNSAAVPVTVNSSASGITASSTTSAETEQQTAVADKTKTTISFPESSLTMDSDTTQVSVTLQSTTIESVASSYQIEASEGAAVAGFDFTLEGASSTFNSGVTVTTYITPGLGTYSDSNKTLKIKYIGDNSGTEPSIVSYDNTSGQLVFTVYHFSKYCIISTERGIVYDSDNNATYKYEKKTGEEEYKLYDKDGNNVTESGNNLVLLDCALSNKVTDALAEKNWTVVHNNCADEESGYWHEQSSNFSGGYGTKLNPYLVSDVDQFTKLYSEMRFKYGYYKWSEENETIDGSNWPTGQTGLSGSFDGNGLTINGLDNAFLYDVTPGKDEDHKLPENDTVNTYTIKNLTINADIHSAYSMAAVVWCVGVHDFVMENVTVHGCIGGDTHVASFVTYGPGNYDKTSDYVAYAGNITFKNCYSDATVATTSGHAVGFIAHAMITKEGNIKLENSVFEGTLVGRNANNLKYVDGNGTSAKITCDGEVQKDYVYNVEGKTEIIENVESKKISDFTPVLKYGDVISVDAENGATTATIALVITPGPGSYTGAFESEVVSPSGGKFCSSKIRYFEVRIKPEESKKTGINGKYYDIMNGNYTLLDSDTIIRFTQYASDGKIVKITDISLCDKTST